MHKIFYGLSLVLVSIAIETFCYMPESQCYMPEEYVHSTMVITTIVDNTRFFY